MVATLLEIRALGEPMDLLGIRIHRGRSAGTISIEQEDTAKALAGELKLKSSFRAVPMAPDLTILNPKKTS
jgi:hypothetical protein